MTTQLLYYPGCSMHGTARAYADSLEVIADRLDLHLHEVDDWSCCGATEFFSIGPLRGHALIARNLALAEREVNGTRTVVAPCSQCYVNLAKTNRYLVDDAALSAQVNTALEAGGLSYTPGSVEVRHLFDVVVNDVGPLAVREQVTRPLAGLRVAPYLGCLITRPDPDNRWQEKEHPLAFDRLLRSLGAEVVDYPLRTDCCGGHLSQISPGMGLEMIRRLLEAARQLDADVMATICPMCQMNIDLYQAEVNRRFHTDFAIPILFFTQLMGLAFGVEPAELGIGREVVSARKALGRIGIDVPDMPEADAVAAAKSDPARSRTTRPKRGDGLPMPRMPRSREDRS
jgi:heterodisulfide reductase subunit B